MCCYAQRADKVGTRSTTNKHRPPSAIGDADAIRRAAIPGLERLRDSWRSLDVTDLCARLGALQLVPENTPFTARLAAAVNIASTIPARPGRGREGSLAWLNSETYGPDLLGKLDDPYEEWFTDSVPFLGGPYTIFPGREAGRGSLLRVLLLALFFDRQFQSPQLVTLLEPTAGAVLKLSDSIAARAGLRPGLGDRVRERQEVRLPDRNTMDRYIRAVRFSDAELTELVSPNMLSDLAPLTRTTPSRISLRRLLDDDEAVRPIWRDRSEHIVTHPLTLAAWLCRWLIEETLRAGFRDELAEALHRAAGLETTRAVDQFGWMPVSRTEIKKTAATLYSEQFWTVDRNRTAHVLVVTDDFKRWEAERIA